MLDRDFEAYFDVASGVDVV